MDDKRTPSEINAVRLSFRTTESNNRKIVEIAREKGWLNSQGRPNVSKVINFIIEHFELPKKRGGRTKRKNRG